MNILNPSYLYMNQNISELILKLTENDQNARSLIPFNPEEILKIDDKNNKEIKKIIDEVGLIKKSEYGKEVASAAWTLVQHLRKEDISYMEKYLKLMKNNPDEVKKSHIALLEDRICMYKDIPQKYGSQTIWDEKTKSLVFHEIEDVKNIDDFRKEFGMKPLKEYAEKLGEMNKLKITLPKGYNFQND